MVELPPIDIPGKLSQITPEDDGCTIVRLGPDANGMHHDNIAKTTKAGTGSGKRFKLKSGSEVAGMSFEPILWAIKGYVPEGFSVLAGRQKLGKTWLALDFGIAVATGGYSMQSIACKQGDVLYLDLENGYRRIKRRLEAIYPDQAGKAGLDRLSFATKCPMVNDGAIAALDDWRNSVENPRLVVIDVLQRIKPVGHRSRNAYENDYSIWSEMQQWATTNSIAVIGLHHTRKGGADDPLEAVSGSNGLSAVADTTLVLDRDSNGTTLYVRGRDVEETETALKFTGGLWEVLGDASEVQMSASRRQIMETLKDAGEPMSPAEIATVANMKRGNVDRLLRKMLSAGKIIKTSRGKYEHRDF